MGTLMAAFGLAGSAHGFSVDDFVISDAHGLSPVAYFEFVAITSNGDQTNIDLGLAVSFGSVGAVTNGMFFEFVNQSADPNELSSITKVLFGAYTGTTGLSPSPYYLEGTDPGVDFSLGGAGGGNQGFPFTVTHELDARSDVPRTLNGVNPGESLLLGYSFASGVDPADVLEGLQLNEWGIGVHLQSTAGGQSEKLIASWLPNGPQDPDPVPEPATIVLLGMGMTFLVARTRHPRI